jgi:hypothetical protein
MKVSHFSLTLNTRQRSPFARASIRTLHLDPVTGLNRWRSRS